MSVGDTKDIKKTASTSDLSNQKLKKGDLVCCYLLNTTDGLTLLERGIVTDVNHLGDVCVLSQDGWIRWWPSTRWTVCEME